MTKTYTKEQKIEIEALARKGVRDVDIAKKVNLRLGVVEVISSHYWQDMMKNKAKDERG
jgi:phosphoribulokinase